MQEKETSNLFELTDLSGILKGRIVALDPGTKRIGVAVCDKTRTVARPLERIERRSWKKLLNDVKDILAEFDATALVIGLPLEFDGRESPMSAEARELARKFGLSLDIPVYLQDERASSYEARGHLWKAGVDRNKTRELVDSSAAVVILTDFLDRLNAVAG